MNSFAPSPTEKGYFNHVRQEYGLGEAVKYELSKAKSSLTNAFEFAQAVAVIGLISFYEVFIEPSQIRRKESELSEKCLNR